MHHIVNPGFVDKPWQSNCTAGQMDGEAGWWTTSGKIGLPPLARVMGVGRHITTCDKVGASTLPCADYYFALPISCVLCVVEHRISVGQQDLDNSTKCAVLYGVVECL